MQTFIQQLLANYNYQTVYLLDILRDVQTRYQHVSDQAIESIAKALLIERTQILSMVEFYSFLSRVPKGRYDIYLSDSITDHMLGKRELQAYLSQQLGVTFGSMTADGLVSLNNTSCTGICDQGPAALVNGHAIPALKKETIDQMVDLISRQVPVDDWPQELLAIADNIHKPGLLLNHPVTQGQALTATVERGIADTLVEIKQSGLRGRGGAGFTTAMKWQFCAEEQATDRYVVCNADEGEPGTFKDRVLLNSYAHQVFEGMTVCAMIIGAKQGFIYLRAEYLHLYEPLKAVLQQRRDTGLLGENLLQSRQGFDIEIRMGAGAYICGEESALIESLEGKPGIPRNRPPYPVASGYLNKPTVVNNVETFLAVAHIAVHGGAAFAALGTKKSKGSKLLSISGDCQRPGIYEVAFGISVAEVLMDCGAEDVMGVQIGGPSGTFVSNQEFERKIAFEDLSTGGSFIVFNKQRNILDIVRNFTRFFAHESCGFCTPCRVGTSLLSKQLDKIMDGHGSAGDVVALDEICQLVKQYSHCGLGQTAANPVLSTLQRYPELYEQHLKEISFEPGFDLDASLDIARQLADRDDAGARLSQVGEQP